MKSAKELVDLGVFFGYPLCCIEEFINNASKSIPYLIKCDSTESKKERRKFYGTGYVPCASCNEKSDKQLIEYINNHRKCEFPFPRDC